jgi:hypothetical protein
MKFWYIGLVLVVVAVGLAGCGGDQATPAPADAGDGETPTSTVLDTSYADALDVNGQLALGTIRLEGTEQAVTPEQAAALLLLWRAIQGGTLQGDVETNAVVLQIEGTMTSEQLAAIAAMQLTQEDLQGWVQDQGLNVGAGEEAGFMGGGQNLSEEERAERMAELGITEDDLPAGMGELSEEEGAALRATAEASGMSFGGGAGTNTRQLAVLLEPLIDLLTEQATG